MSKTVLFFGSGPVAARSLALLKQHVAVEAVITKPTTLNEMSLVAGDSPVFTVSNRQELDTVIQDHAFMSKVGVLIDFGIIVSQLVIDSFERGIINSHFSLLPEWRGADPITFSILSGQQKTGVSLMLLVEKMDEGPILAFGELPIANQTASELTEQLVQLSDKLLQKHLLAYIDNGSELIEQDSLSSRYGRAPSYSRKLTKADGVIDWQKSAEQVAREIRAFHDWPKSRTILANKDVIITAAHVVDISGAPGALTVDQKQLIIACIEKSLSVDTLKPAGKREMTAAEFLAGYGHLIS